MTIRTSSQARGAKAKGRQTEQAVVDWLRQRGYAAERRRLTGTEDVGDIGGIPGLVVEVKHGGLRDAPGGLAELATETANADKRWPADAPHLGFLVCKKKGTKNPEAWYCLMPLAQVVSLLDSAGIHPSGVPQDLGGSSREV
jgi:hypothetical protein